MRADGHSVAVLAYCFGSIVLISASPTKNTPPAEAKCDGKPYHEQPIKYFYVEEETNNCVGFREGCTQLDSPYDDLQSCVNDNLKVGYVKTLKMSCNDGWGVVLDADNKKPYFTKSCAAVENFCPLKSKCISGGNFAFCCQQNLPNGNEILKLSPEEADLQEQSPCLKKKIKFYYNQDVQQCIAYRDTCEEQSPSYDKIEDCMRQTDFAKIYAKRVKKVSYWCMDGMTPASTKLSNGVRVPVVAMTTCSEKQFCHSSQMCMQRAKLAYCCKKGSPSGVVQFALAALKSNTTV